jgi:hypothetical protein
MDRQDSPPPQEIQQRLDNRARDGVRETLQQRQRTAEARDGSRLPAYAKHARAT